MHLFTVSRTCNNMMYVAKVRYLSRIKHERVHIMIALLSFLKIENFTVENDTSDIKFRKSRKFTKINHFFIS